MNIELKRLFPNQISYKLAISDTLDLQFVSKEEEKEKIFNVQEAIAALKTKHDLFTFQGVIQEKDFSKPLSSRTGQKVKVVPYGTPGDFYIFCCLFHILKSIFRSKNTYDIFYY